MDKETRQFVQKETSKLNVSEIIEQMIQVSEKIEECENVICDMMFNKKPIDKALYYLGMIEELNELYTMLEQAYMKEFEA